jgi:hypothetical protein
VFTYLGNLSSYVKNALFPQVDLNADMQRLQHPVQSAEQSLQYGEDVAKSIGHNIAKTASDLVTSPADFTSKTLQGFKEGLANFKQNPVTTLIKGAGSYLIETPIKALTATTNQNGIAVPATPEEQAKSVQDLAGNLAAGVAYEGVAKALTTDIAGLSDAATVAMNNSSRMGRLGKTILKEMGATGLASGAQSAISNLGQDDYTAKLAASFLSMPAFEIAAGFGLMKNVKSETLLAGKMSKINNSQYDLAQNQALARTLQITENTTPIEALDRVDALSTAEDQLDLAIKAKKPFVFPFATDDQIQYIKDRVKANIVIGPDNTVLVTHSLIGPKTRSFFEVNGFLPNETVSVLGMDAKLKDVNDAGQAFITNIADNKSHIVDIASVLRKPNSVAEFEQEVPKASSPTETRTVKTKIEPLAISKENVLERMYQKFLVKFNPDVLQDDSFDGKVAKFLQVNKIPDTQQGNVLSFFYSRLAEDYKSSMPLEEQSHIRDAQEIIKRNLYNNLFNQATTVADRAIERGNYIINDGGGRYSLYDGNAGAKIKSFTSYEEMGKFLDALPQDNGKALDGGGTGQTNTAIGNQGQFAFAPARNPIQDFLANMRSGAMGSFISPVVQRITAISNATKSGEMGAKVADQIVRASQYKHSFILNHLQDVVNTIQSASKLKGVDFDRIGDYMSTSSLEEKMRWANPAEHQLATQLAGFGANLDNVREYLYAKRVTNDPAVLKSVDPTVQKAGDFFESLIGQEGIKPRVIIGLADAMMNPLDNLSQAQWKVTNRLTNVEEQAHNMLRGAFNQMAKLAGIPEEDFIKQYLPIMRKYGSIFDTKWTSPELPDKFAHELTRLDITPVAMRNVNALELAYKYMMSLASVKSGAYDLLNSARKDAENWKDGVNSLIATSKDPLEQAKLLQHGNSILPNVDQWIANVRGIPNFKEGDPTLLAAKFGDTFKVRATPNSVMYLVSTAKLGFKPAMLMMDIMSAHTLGYTLFGGKILKDALYMPVKDSYVASLVRRGELPPLTGENLISLNPQYVGSDLLAKMNEVGLIASGQEYAYRKISAGFYKALFEKTLDVTNKYITKQIPINKIPEELGDVLTVHDASKQQYAMNLIMNNKFEDAARYLAREGSAKIANRFGDMYNPLSWQRSTFGRLLGQFNSWGANATSSMFDALSNGTPRQIGIRALRATAANALAFTAVSAAGFDASRYLTIPITTFPGGGPLLQTGWDVVRNAQNAMSNDDQRRQYAMQHLQQDFSGLFEPTLMYDMKRARDIWLQNATQLQVLGQMTGMKAVIK